MEVSYSTYEYSNNTWMRLARQAPVSFVPTSCETATTKTQAESFSHPLISDHTAAAHPLLLGHSVRIARRYIVVSMIAVPDKWTCVGAPVVAWVLRGCFAATATAQEDNERAIDILEALFYRFVNLLLLCVTTTQLLSIIFANA